ncbi:hypothetical protein RSOLAG1IB_05870 [Rhizoctonia solani AG-1 IB]|uniref:Uncharacterized protein n=1 Tax=Thanatephorus cucumeris (strain AG1-IB / isolate 7/3/14) TaxID=1108050 RepID=A0A0B7F564_THACB|nr:hypothetical protein RSOLAG1IB_05870 [Rhizoctonia solani AG-1 IB]
MKEGNGSVEWHSRRRLMLKYIQVVKAVWVVEERPFTGSGRQRQGSSVLRYTVDMGVCGKRDIKRERLRT